MIRRALARLLLVAFLVVLTALLVVVGVAVAAARGILAGLLEILEAGDEWTAGLVDLWRAPLP